MLYIISSCMYGIVGYMHSMLMRLELWYSNRCLIWLVNVSYYNISVSIHGIVMIFYLVMPMFISGLGNIIWIVGIGVSDVMYVRCNNVSVIIYISTYVVVISCVMIEYNNGIGWTMYPPLSSIVSSISCIEVYNIMIGIMVLGVSSSLSMINIWVSVLCNRWVGYVINSMLVYIYSLLLVCIILCIVLPILSIWLCMLLIDIVLNGMYYDIVLGGDCIYYEHLFWLFGHPEVYVLIVPSFGIVSYMLLFVCCKLYSMISIEYCIGIIGVIGCWVWWHHMLVIGMDSDSWGYYSCITCIVSMPSGCKILNWCISVVGCYIKDVWIVWYVLLLMWICMYEMLFVCGGCSGICIGSVCIDICLHDSYYIVIHFHIVLSSVIVVSMLMVVMHVGRHMCMWIGISSVDKDSVIYYVMIVMGMWWVLVGMYMIGYSVLCRRIIDMEVYVLMWVDVSVYGMMLILVGVVI